MNKIQLTFIITLFFALTLAGCRGKADISQGEWQLSYGQGVNIRYGKLNVAQNMSAEYQLENRIVSTGDYDSHAFDVQRISDDFGKGKKWVITYTDSKLPTLTQTFCIYDKYILTDISLTHPGGVSTNYMAPVVIARTDSIISSPTRRSLFVPFDNDAWIRYASRPNTSDTLRSYEVTSIYDASSREGIVIGAIDHNQWKNAVELAHNARQLKAYSGVADDLTRDRRAHGTVSGTSVGSARVMIGVFDDWRTGMEFFAYNNAIVAHPRQWQKAMPVGWNSWGALAFKVNHHNSTLNSDFFAQHLQNHSFVNADGLLYTGLDSGWNSFTEDELKDFATRCRRNHQVPCIYWTPFTDWSKDPDREVPGVEQYHYKDIYLYANGEPQELDGAYAIDPTHPAVQRMMEQTADLFRRCGYQYVKMDFMTHGRMEADNWYRKDIHTGTEAYNYGMHLLDSIFSDMYLNLSISPIFPAQYAQSRRIACDAWNKIKDTEYTMNALSYGWWIDRVYQYNDADHVVLRDATEGENRARITSSVITGLFITGDDFSSDSVAIARAERYLTNADINAIATGRSFRPLRGDDEQSESVFIRQEDNGTVYLAVFNYGEGARSFNFNRNQMQLDGSANYDIEELWSHTKADIEEPVTVPEKDVKVFRIKKI